MSFGDDGVLDALGAGGIVDVHGAVVELANADREAGVAEQAALDAVVAALGLACGSELPRLLADRGEGLAHPVGARAEDDGLASTAPGRVP